MDNCEVVLRLVRREAKHPSLIAIDGRCAAGKTTLAEKIRSSMECNVIHMDDFYLPFSKRTEEKMAQPGGNMDFERLLFEILFPLKNGTNALYRPYDCHHDTFLPSKELNAAVPTIVEGSYSCHPMLRSKYDLRVFMDISPERQQIRLKERDPSSLEKFHTIWIPREEHYFTVCQIRSCCDLVIQEG